MSQAMSIAVANTHTNPSPGGAENSAALNGFLRDASRPTAARFFE